MFITATFVFHHPFCDLQAQKTSNTKQKSYSLPFLCVRANIRRITEEIKIYSNTNNKQIFQYYFLAILSFGHMIPPYHDSHIMYISHP